MLKYEGVVSIVTEGKQDAHVVNTWNSYLKITGDKRLIGPMGGMNVTEVNLKENSKEYALH